MPREIKVWDVDGKTLRNGKRFVAARYAGHRRAVGGRRHPLRRGRQYLGGRRPGVQIIAPTGERIGMIRLPETCANVCFGGTRRNRLFMTASQSLYAVYVETTGAHIA